MKMLWYVTALLFIFSVTGAAGATLPQYDNALAQVQAALEARIPAIQAHEIPSGQPPQFVARRVLAPITSVGPDKGRQQPVNNSALLRELAAADRKGDIAQMKALDRQVMTLRAELALPAARQALPASAVALAHSILARSEFGSDPFPPPPLSERIARWINAQLNKIHWPHASNYNGPNFNLPPVSPGFIKTLLILVAGGAVAVLIFVIIQLLSKNSRRGRPAPLLDEAEQMLVEARDTDSLFALAERQAREGDHRHAFRLIYIATLIALDTGGVLRFNRSRTNWEYLRALRASGRDDVYRAMMPLTREFDRIWYGFAPAGPAEYARAVAQFQALQSAPPPAARAAT